LPRTDRRIDLCLNGAFAIGVEQKMAERHFPAERDVGKYLLHDPRRIDGLTRAEVQEINVQAVGFVGEVRGDPDGKSFRMWRAGGTVGAQSGQLTLALDDFRIGIEDFSKLAMKTYADIGGKVRIFRHQTLRGAHDEFEMSDVIAVLRADHQ